MTKLPQEKYSNLVRIVNTEAQIWICGCQNIKQEC